MEYYSKEIDEWLKSIGIHHDPIKNTYSKITGKEVPEKIAFFAHGGFAYAFISYILGIRFPNYASHFSCLNTCGVCEFDFDFNSNVVRLLRYNELHYDHDKAT